MILNDLCDLEKKVKFMRFKLGIRHNLLVLCTKFCEDMSNISLDTERKPSFICFRLKWPLWPWKKGQVYPIQTWSLNKRLLGLVMVLVWSILGEDTSNISWDIERKPSFMLSSYMTSVTVTLKMRSRSPGSKLVFGLPWCSCVPYLVRIRHIFLQLLSRNHLSHAVTLNDLCDLENEVKVTRFKNNLRLAQVLLCTKFGEDTSIFLVLLSGYHLAYACPPRQRDNIIRVFFKRVHKN